MAVDNFMWFSAAASGGNLASNATKPAGETQDKFFKTKNALEILSISFGATQAETTSSMSGGSSAGKIKFDEFTIEKFVDLSSVPIFNACVAGAHFPTVHVAIRKAGGDMLNYFQVIFRQLFVTSISITGGGGDEAPKETIKFKFNAMGVQYIRQLATGAAGVPIQAMWSVATGKPELTVPGLSAADQFETK